MGYRLSEYQVIRWQGSGYQKIRDRNVRFLFPDNLMGLVYCFLISWSPDPL